MIWKRIYPIINKNGWEYYILRVFLQFVNLQKFRQEFMIKLDVISMYALSISSYIMCISLHFQWNDLRSQGSIFMLHTVSWFSSFITSETKQCYNILSDPKNVITFLRDNRNDVWHIICHKTYTQTIHTTKYQYWNQSQVIWLISKLRLFYSRLWIQFPFNSVNFYSVFLY